MILSGHQPNYLPGVGLFIKIALSDKFMYVSEVQFDKKSWQNRNRIRTKDGWIWLTVPTLTKGKSEQKISEVEINNQLEWGKKHFQSIRLNYCKAPYYNYYIDFFEALYQKEWINLSELNIYITNYILKELRISTKILYDVDFEFHKNKTDRLVEMCEATNCDIYLSNKGSENYVSIPSFQTLGKDHLYVHYLGKEYPQVFRGFEPNLSILDMLFNCGPDESRKIIKDRSTYILSEINQKL